MMLLSPPHFNYCDVVWDGTSKKSANDLQTTGNFAARALLGLKKRSSATAALKKLDMMPLCEKRKVHIGVFVHKVIKQNAPKSIVDRYGKQLERNHKHETRAASRGDMITMAHRTSRFDNSTQQRAIKCWNRIPVDLRNTDSTSTFKKDFQKLLLTNYKNDKTDRNVVQ